MTVKVLFVHNNILGESGEAAMFYFPAMLADHGYDVTIVARAGGDSQHFINKSISVFEVGFEKNWLFKVIQIIKEKQPDIVHVFLYSGAGLVPLSANFFCCAKFVLDIRSPLLRNGFVRFLHRIKNWFEPIFFDAITSHGIESSWTQIGKRYDVSFLPPGVDLSLIQSSVFKETKNSDKPSKLVYIGSLDKLRKPIKMLEAVISAAKSCHIQLDIYGDGSEREYLEKFIIQHSATNYICFKGVIDRKSLFKKLLEYDLGLAYIPSGMYDAAPALKTLEYLACGLPVLATSTLGNKMFIQHGVNGFLSDENSFTEQIIKIVNEVALSEIRGNTRSSVNAFDWQKIVDERLIPIYQKLLKQMNN